MSEQEQIRDLKAEIYDLQKESKEAVKLRDQFITAIGDFIGIKEKPVRYESVAQTVKALVEKCREMEAELAKKEEPEIPLVEAEVVEEGGA